MAKILLAEDDHSMRGFIQKTLADAGHSVVSCADGMRAMSQIKSKNADYDLLLTDIVMPGMDGVELSQKASDLIPNLKVMFITGFAAVALDKRNTANPINGNKKILSKPFHLKELVREVNALLMA